MNEYAIREDEVDSMVKIDQDQEYGLWGCADFHVHGVYIVNIPKNFLDIWGADRVVSWKVRLWVLLDRIDWSQVVLIDEEQEIKLFACRDFLNNVEYLPMRDGKTTRYFLYHGKYYHVVEEKERAWRGASGEIYI